MTAEGHGGVWLLIGSREDWGFSRHIGYYPSDIVNEATYTSFENTSGGTANSLTRIMVLHPIACGLAFIAFLTTLGSRTILSSVSGLLVSGLTWALVLVSLVIDFTAFDIIIHVVKDHTSGLYPKASFGSAMWCLVASFILLSGRTIVIGMSFFGVFRERKLEKRSAAEAQTASITGAKKKRFGIF